MSPPWLDQADRVVGEQPRLPGRPQRPDRVLHDRQVDERDTRGRAGVAQRGWSARSRAAPANTVSRTPRPWVGQQVPPEAVRAGAPSPATARRVRPCRARRPGRRRPARRAASARTPSFAAITWIRRGTQNSSATSERVDHSAPIQVAPPGRPATAAAAPKPTPRRPARPEVERRLGRNRSTLKSAAVVGGPQTSSGATSVRAGLGLSRHCCAALVLIWQICCIAAGRARSAAVGLPKWVRAMTVATIQPSTASEQQDLDEPAGAEAVQLGAQQAAEGRAGATGSPTRSRDGGRCTAVTAGPR